MFKQWSWVFVVLLALTSLEAEAARRLGGGRSIGKQSSNVTQQQAAPAGPPATAPAAPGSAAAAQAAKPVPATPAAAPPAPRKPWGAMLGGLAAGLGLAWLAQSLGLGAAFGQVLMFILLAVVLMAAWTWFRRSRPGAAGRPSAYAFQGAASGAAGSAQVLRQYSPDHVGNDASARPWEQHSSFDAPSAADGLSHRPQGGGLQIGSALAASGANWSVPADFDAEGFLAAAKRNFVTLQNAWDRSDMALLRTMMTDGMLDEVRAQLAEREAHRPGEPNATEVVMLEARLLGIEHLAHDYMASVEFSGMIREEPSAGPSPFREVWNMTKPRDGSGGWLVAGVQALQ